MHLPCSVSTPGNCRWICVATPMAVTAIPTWLCGNVRIVKVTLDVVGSSIVMPSRWTRVRHGDSMNKHVIS